MSQLAVFVMSCDAYADLWSPFFSLFFKYWPACPYPVYLLANHLDYSDERVTTIKVGDDINWAHTFSRGLQAVPEPYVLLLLEDYLFEAPVDSARIEALFDYMREKNAAYLRLRPSPPPDMACPDNDDVGEISKGAAYRLTTQAGLWDRQILLSLVKEGETPWQFEIEGSRRTDELDRPFLSIRKGISWPIKYYWYTAVFRGAWCRDAVRMCKREGIDVDLSSRQLEPWGRYFRRLVEKHWPALFRLQRRIKAKLKRALNLHHSR
ncbi:MAG: hypothetical protein JW966_05450 [Anaerolineae bacterium]|nr:hypothetical protein [Anaerolineae bacterium]